MGLFRGDKRPQIWQTTLDLPLFAACLSNLHPCFAERQKRQETHAWGARAALTKSPRAESDANSGSETGPLAELATLNAENFRLRAELANAKAQLSAHLLNCEAPASAEAPFIA